MSRPITAAKRPSLDALTGLRFLAAAQVVLFHSMGPRLEQLPPAVANLIGAGYTGVSLFFVLSGFVLAYNYLTPGLGGVRRTGDFLAARVARIYPVYLLGVLVALPGLVLRLLRTETAGDAVVSGAPVVLSALTLTQAWIPSFACQLNCPGWSLSVEAVFYLAFPALAVLLAPRSRSRLLPIMAACWGLSILMGWSYLRADPDGLGAVTPLSAGFWLDVLKYNPLVRLPEFVIGICLGLVFLATPNLLGRRAAAVTLGSIGAILLVLMASDRIPYPILNNGLLLGPFGVLIVGLASASGLPARLLATPPMRRLGEASYALYILHVPIHSVLRRIVPATGPLAPQSTGFLVVYLVGSVLISIGVLTLLEEPARLAVRNAVTRWSAQWARRAPVAATEKLPKMS
ncbi:MAG: acyltransferase family protein [Gemmatimonadales bacterium]